MAYSVSSAFTRFISDYVNLDPEDTNTARSSRDWLVDKWLLNFPKKDEGFPLLHPDSKMWFGSFARNTKIRELDDIDMMVVLHAEGSTYDVQDDTYILRSQEGSRLNKFLDADGYINSKRIINKFVSNLQTVEQYDKADIHRKGEAATLKMKSYTWNFDIVPAFWSSESTLGESFYVIPDGNGHWKRTDPRIDKNRTTELNKKYDGKILEVIRLVKKYWKERYSHFDISSYLLETMILNRYDSLNSNYRVVCIYYEFVFILESLSIDILNRVDDHKGIQGDINNLNGYDRQKVREMLLADIKIANDAIEIEYMNPHGAGRLWQRIFGNDFPVED